MCWLSKLFKSGLEKPSPSDIVPETSITVYEALGQVVINVAKLNVPFTKLPKVWMPGVPDTGSMDPSFDFEHNNILIAGADEVDHQKLVDFLKVGDIAVYRVMESPTDDLNDFSKAHKIYAIHRIMEIGKDSEGRYFRFQGDNNAVKDPYKVRDNEVLYLCIGTIF